MGVRVGVDVGGTFTKAIAFDLALDAIVAETIVSTTHDHVDGVGGRPAETVHEVNRLLAAQRGEAAGKDDNLFGERKRVRQPLER